MNLLKNELPETWRKTSFEDIADIGAGNPAPQGEQFFKDGTYPFVRVQDMGRLGMDKYVTDTADHINEHAIKKLKCFPKGTVLFTKSGASSLLNQRALLKSDMYVVSHIATATPFDGISSDYLYYWLRTIDFNHIAHATTLPSIPLSKVCGIQLPVAPTTEQNQIVSLLEELFSDLDNAIENLKKAKEQLKVYRQAVLQFAFDGRLTNKNLRESNLPEGWRQVFLGDVCSSVEYGSASKSKKEGKIPVLRMGNIQNGKFDWTDLVYTNDENEIEKYSLRKGDVLFNRTNSPELVGKTAIYQGERPAIFAGYLIRINKIESLIDASYLTYYLNSHRARQYGNSVKSFGVNQSNINGTKLKTYPLPLAPLGEQRLIVEEIESRFSICDKMEESIEENLEKANVLRRSLLQQAFSGDLTEQWRKEHKDLISGENSSEELLRKIKAEKEALQVKPKGKKKHD